MRAVMKHRLPATISFFFFQAEDGIRDTSVLEFRRVLFRSAPDTLRTLGWSLLHFVWQGFALAAVASVALTLFRRASTRYIVGVLTLFAMVASVACTFVEIGRASCRERGEFAVIAAAWERGQ